jgi:transmembrane sensor
MSNEQDKLVEEAIGWLGRLGSGRARDRAGFAAWRARSPAHEVSAREAEALWRDLGETDHALAFRAQVLLHAAPPRPPARSRRAVVGMSVAASTVLVLGTSQLLPLSSLRADHSTGTGERREVRLPDGSVVLLNTGSALSVSFTAQKRQVELLRGEALFQVAKDQARPFLVRADAGSVRAVGTEFAVRTLNDAIRVSVTEGVVEVLSDEAPAGAIRLKAGQTVTYGRQGRLGALQAVDTGAETAWRRGKLIFVQRPLAEVLTEIERYQRGRILILDDRLRRLNVTGVFDLADPAGSLAAIAQGLQADLTRLPLLTLLH